MTPIMPLIPSSPLIDLREAIDFAQGHYQDAANFPLPNLEERLFELPNNQVPLRLCGDPKMLAEASLWLNNKGYVIEEQLVWNRELAKKLRQLELLSKGGDSPILWSPAPILRNFIERLDSGELKLAARESTELDSPAQPRRALDLACGSGRDAVYLALAGWQVDAIDYLPGALAKARKLAENCGVSVNTLMMDLEQSTGNFERMQEQYDLILVVRYLHRPLFSQIREKIRPGGYLVYQTFIQGCEQFGSPKNPRFLLKPHELTDFFHDFDIILDQVHHLADGRPTNVFIARKPCR